MPGHRRCARTGRARPLGRKLRDVWTSPRLFDMLPFFVVGKWLVLQCSATAQRVLVNFQGPTHPTAPSFQLRQTKKLSSSDLQRPSAWAPSMEQNLRLVALRLLPRARPVLIDSLIECLPTGVKARGRLSCQAESQLLHKRASYEAHQERSTNNTAVMGSTEAA